MGKLLGISLVNNGQAIALISSVPLLVSVLVHSVSVIKVTPAHPPVVKLLHAHKALLELLVDLVHVILGTLEV